MQQNTYVYERLDSKTRCCNIFKWLESYFNSCRKNKPDKRKSKKSNGEYKSLEDETKEDSKKFKV